jgi:hypothetical protein
VSYRTRSSVQELKNSFDQFRIQSTPVVGLRYYFPHSAQE